MGDQKKTPFHWLASFASLRWYDEVIKFTFSFVTKTSELLLAAGIVVSTANFLTDGDVMSHNKTLSDAWSWAQAVAIDSSLGIVFMNAWQALRERDKIKAVIFFTLTALLALVAGLITHFDALAHAAGLPVTDKGVSGMLPLWVMTALRSIAVIGFLLASRLKHIAFRELRQGWKPEQNREAPREPVAAHIDYTALANALVDAMQQKGASGRVNVSEEPHAVLPLPEVDSTDKWEPAVTTASGSSPQHSKRRPNSRTHQEEPADVKLARVYAELQVERASHQVSKPISARDLSQRANVRRSTCSQWLRKQGASQAEKESAKDDPLLGANIPRDAQRVF